jgi:hypothetical protein
MRTPGFTAASSLRLRPAGYRGAVLAGVADPHALSPQTIWGDCSDGSPALCYFCDDSRGCYCDWYYGKSYVVSTDCGSG